MVVARDSDDRCSIQRTIQSCCRRGDRSERRIIPLEAIMRTDWSRAAVAEIFELPFTELVLQAAEIHRTNHAPGQVQLCTLLSIKTGGCPEDCGYCSQSAHAGTGLKAGKLMDADRVLASAHEARAQGSQRFCMGAAWRELKDRDL